MGFNVMMTEETTFQTKQWPTKASFRLTCTCIIVYLTPLIIQHWYTLNATLVLYSYSVTVSPPRGMQRPDFL